MEDDKKPRKKPPSQQGDGNIYEQSSRPQSKTGTKKPSTTGRKPTSSRPSAPPTKKKPTEKKSQFAIFYVVALFVAVIVCIMIFAVVFSSVSDGDSEDPEATEITGTSLPTTSPAVVNESKEIVGIISDIDKDNFEIEIVDVNTGENYDLKADGTTEVKDNYSQNIIFAELSKGDIVDGKFDTNTMLLSSLSQNSDAWEKKNVDNVNVDAGLKSISVDGKNYTYSSDTIVDYKEQTLSVEEIAPMDIVTLKGYKDEVWYIEVIKGHGKLTITNAGEIENGTIEVDTSEFKELSETEPIMLIEGPHKVVIKGDNIEPFTKDVQITPGEISTIDLSEAQFKSSVLTVKTNVDSPTITIEGVTYPPNEPIILDLGEYIVDVTKEGYLPWSQTVNLDKPEFSLSVELVESIPMCNVTIAANTEGAEVYIDNGYVGVAPVTELVPYGIHTVTIKNEGYEDYTIEWEAAKEMDGFSANLKPVIVDAPVTETP